MEDDIPKDRHWLAKLAQNPTWRNDQSIVHALYVDPLFSSLSDSSDIPPELVHFVFDIGKNVGRTQSRECFGDETAGNSESFLVRCDVKRDVELVQFPLQAG